MSASEFGEKQAATTAVMDKSEQTTLNPKAEESRLSGNVSTPEDVSEKSELARRHSAVQDLAREFTKTTGIDVHDDPARLFHHDDPESPLNPNGNRFDARTWAKTVAKLTEDHGIGFRRSGFAFQNMNVHG